MSERKAVGAPVKTVRTRLPAIDLQQQQQTSLERRADDDSAKFRTFKRVKRRSFLATDHLINATLAQFKTEAASLAQRDHMLIPNVLGMQTKAERADQQRDDGDDLLEFAQQLEENQEDDVEVAWRQHKDRNRQAVSGLKVRIARRSAVLR